MISNPFFLVSIVVSAFLAFFTMAVVVELVFKLFSVKSYRLRQMLRFLPFISLVVDFLFNRFSIGNWLNPLSCASCLQKLVLQLFFPDLNNYLNVHEISLVNYLAVDGFNYLFIPVFIAFCGVTGFFFLRKLYHIFVVCGFLRLKKKQGSGCKVTIRNALLAEGLRKAHVEWVVDDQIQMPMTGYKPFIYLSSKLRTILSEEEFEAVVAHELEHIRHKDSAFKMVCQLIATLGWWIPTRSWINKIEHDLELACDEGTAKYKIRRESLASAMLKLVKQSRTQWVNEVCYFTNQTHPILIRVQTLLGIVPSVEKNLLWGGGIGVAIGALIVFVCMQWL